MVLMKIYVLFGVMAGNASNWFHSATHTKLTQLVWIFLHIKFGVIFYAHRKKCQPYTKSFQSVDTDPCVRTIYFSKFLHLDRVVQIKLKFPKRSSICAKNAMQLIFVTYNVSFSGRSPLIYWHSFQFHVRTFVIAFSLLHSMYVIIYIINNVVRVLTERDIGPYALHLHKEKKRIHSLFDILIDLTTNQKGFDLIPKSENMRNQRRIPTNSLKRGNKEKRI